MKTALGLALLLLLPACVGSRPDGGSAAVEFWAIGREGEVVEQLLPGLERAAPGLRVRVQRIPWSAAHEKLLTAYVGDSMPDVFQVGNTWIPEFAAIGALAPLDERLARAASAPAADFFPGILETNVVDGVTYGVPWYVDTRLLFYRADLLRRAGWERAPRTWEEWRAAMLRVKERAGPGAYAILLPFAEWQTPVVLALQLGAELLREGDSRGNFRGAEFRRAFEFYLDLFRRDLAPRGGDAQVANVYQDFARGFFAFYVTGPWNIGEFGRRLPADVLPHWATAPMPAPSPPFPGVSLAGGASLVLSSRSRRPDAAWRVIEYLSEPEQQAAFHRLTGDLPSRRAAWAAADLARDPYAAAFWRQLQHLRSTPRIPEWERVAARIGQYAEAAIRGDASPDEALERLDRDVDAILEKRRWMARRRAAASAAADAAGTAP